jgi:hypothetical protein
VDLGQFVFVAGWMLLFHGHRTRREIILLFQGPVYLLVGPIWVAKEIWDFLTGKRPQAEADAPKTERR